MNASQIITALDLPPESRVDQRVPKKLLVDNGAPTAADKRLINECVEEIQWLAALKPTTIGVPAYRDSVREYLEIAVLRLSLRHEAKASRLNELVHRAVPYPVFLVTSQNQRVYLSLAHKRWSQNATEATVLEDRVIQVELEDAESGQIQQGFQRALALKCQPSTTLHALYQGWIDTLLALQAARVSGSFAVSKSREQAVARQEAMRECERLEAQIAALRVVAAKQKQLSRQVELNLELKVLQAALIAEQAKL